MKFSIVSAKFSPQSLFFISRFGVSCQGGYILADSYLDSFGLLGRWSFVAELMSFNEGPNKQPGLCGAHVHFFAFGFSESKRSELSENHFFSLGKMCHQTLPQKKVLKMMYVSFACVFSLMFFSGFSLGALRKSIVKKGRWPKGGAGVWGVYVIKLHQRFLHLLPCRQDSIGILCQKSIWMNSS